MKLKLTLNDFKTFSGSHCFRFNNQHSLISGRSGIGKSTLVDAIVFAITGQGRSLPSWGKKSCSVDLDVFDAPIYSRLSIHRSKCPNRLCLQTNERCMYEDQTAQDILDRVFGEHFSSVSVLSQDDRKSFVNTSPSDKLEFLRNLVFPRGGPQWWKNQVKGRIKQSELNISGKDSEIKVLERVLNECEVDADSEPPDVPSVPDLSEFIDREDETDCGGDDLEILIDIKGELMSQIHSTRNRIDRCTALQGDIDTHQKLLTRLIGECDDTVGEESDDEGSIDERISGLKKELKEHAKLQQSRRRYIELVKMTGELREKEETEHERKLNEAKQWVLSEQERAECKECIDEQNRMTDRYKEWKRHDREVSKLSGEYDSSGLKRMYMRASWQCPGCDARVYIRNKRMELLDGGADSDSEEFDEEYVKRQEYLKERLDDLTAKSPVECKTGGSDELIERHRTRLQRHKTSTELLKTLETGYKPSSILRGYTRELDELSKVDGIDLPGDGEEAELRNQLKRAENHREVKYYRNLIDSNLRKLKRLPEYQSALSEETKSLETLNRLIESVRKYITSRSNCERYTRELSRRKELEDQLKKVRWGREREWEFLRALQHIKSKLVEAEMKCVDGVLRRINGCAQEYLASFFPDTPISIQLLKDPKKVYWSCKYKDTELSRLDSLSGGERSRVVLAYTLALAETFQCPLVLLDECVANLDAITTESVIECLRKVCVHTKTILIAHQVVEGVFDEVIKVEEGLTATV